MAEKKINDARQVVSALILFLNTSSIFNKIISRMISTPAWSLYFRKKKREKEIDSKENGFGRYLLAESCSKKAMLSIFKTLNINITNHINVDAIDQYHTPIKNVQIFRELT